MRTRALFSVVVLAVVSMAPSARASGPGVLRSLADELIAAGQRAANTVVAPFTGEARSTRIESLWPSLSTALAEVRSAAIETAGGVVEPDLAERLLARGPVDLATVPGVALNLETVEDVNRLLTFAPAWSRAASATASARSFALDEFRVCPIKGRHWFQDTWGAARESGRTHKGTDLMSLHGMKLYAMETGRIIQMNWHWAGGRTLYLLGDTSGDVYYYAHMDGYARTIGLGSRVDAGDHLGWVGYTGNADSPHLHLGWMPGTGGVDFDRLENPYYLLRDLCP